ncbi:MAG: glycogen synthase GlgA [Chromatiales bacterium]|nr:glycogen synthase GlgA [Chromatiales bacterium]
MHILFASSEAHPLIKTGGLADISASLPDALKRLKQDVRLVLPAYLSVKAALKTRRVVQDLDIPGAHGKVSILEGILPGTRVPLYLIDCPPYFDRAGDPYRATDGRDWQDNHLRFGLFNRVLVKIALGQAGLDWTPGIVHCNDWQTGLAPALLSLYKGRPPTVFTVHNLAYQGLFPLHVVDDLMLPPELLGFHQGLEFHHHISFIKGGLAYADRITTVSPTYAREIRSQQFGYGLEGLLNHRAHDLSGILNGVDYRHWDPARDEHLVRNYDANDLRGKAACKEDLQTHFGLHVRADVPLFANIGRMVEQKGIDLILAAFGRLLREQEIQLVILGNGERRFEQAVRQLAQAFPRQVGVHVGYDEGLAHRIEAGADFFLMPSRFEPCGLNQMYSLRYGTLPIVHRTGGLADTVVDTHPGSFEDGSATGFVFEPPTTEALLGRIHEALALWRDHGIRDRLIGQGMRQDFGWDISARRYLDLYESLR